MSRRGWLLFLSLCVIWGIPYLLIRVAVAEVSPPALVFLRTAPAALLLLPWALRQGNFRTALKYWPWVLAFTLSETTVPWLLLAHAEQRISSSLAGLLIATVPLLAAVLCWLIGHDDRLDLRRVVGLVIGFGGVAALVGLDIGHIDPWALGEMLVVACSYALAPVIVSRRLSDAPTLWVVSASLGFTALVYAPLTLTQFPSSISTAGATAVALLALVCTALPFPLFFALIREVGPTRSTVITYVNPAVAVLAGVIVLSEPFTAGMAVGFPLVLVGSLLGTARRPTAVPAPLPRKADT